MDDILIVTSRTSSVVLDSTAEVTKTVTQLPGSATQAASKVMAPAQEATGLGRYTPQPPDAIKAALTSPMQPMNDLAHSAANAVHGKSVSSRQPKNFSNDLVDGDGGSNVEHAWGKLGAIRNGLHGLDQVTEGLTEAIVQVVGHQRARAVADAFARQDVITMKWLLDLTHQDAMDLADASGLTRHEMLRLREVAADIHTKHLAATSGFIGKDAESAAAPSLVPCIPSKSARLGLRSLLTLQCIGRASRPVTPAHPAADASARPSRYTKDRRHKGQESDFYAHVPSTGVRVL